MFSFGSMSDGDTLAQLMGGAGCRGLRRLDLSGCQVGDTGIQHLVWLTGQRTRRIAKHLLRVGTILLLLPPDPPGLEELMLRGSSRLSDLGVCMLAQGLGRRLRVLDLGGCDGLSGAALDFVCSSMCSLEHIDLSDCRKMGRRGRCPILTHLCKASA